MERNAKEKTWNNRRTLHLGLLKDPVRSKGKGAKSRVVGILGSSRDVIQLLRKIYKVACWEIIIVVITTKESTTKIEVMQQVSSTPVREFDDSPANNSQAKMNSNAFASSLAPTHTHHRSPPVNTMRRERGIPSASTGQYAATFSAPNPSFASPRGATSQMSNSSPVQPLEVSKTTTGVALKTPNPVDSLSSFLGFGTLADAVPLPTIPELPPFGEVLEEDSVSYKGNDGWEHFENNGPNDEEEFLKWAKECDP
jgi:hypothetical protein